MRVFVAGASGVIGRPLVDALLQRRHEVTAMTRSAERAEDARKRGARSVVCDVFDREALRGAVAAAAPEVVVHQLTALPKRIDPRKGARDLAATNRIRTEGTDALVEAAKQAGARRFVAQSIAFAYAPSTSNRLPEDAPLLPPVMPGAEETVAAVAHLERAVTTGFGPNGLVLRYGFFYGPGTVYHSQGGSIHEDVMRRRFPMLRDGHGTFSFVHVDDAAEATVLAVESSGSGILNVVEDRPAPIGEWLPAYARSIGAKPPRRLLRWLVRLAAGPYAVYLLGEMPGASNDRARDVLGWAPRRAWDREPVLDHR